MHEVAGERGQRVWRVTRAALVTMILVAAVLLGAADAHATGEEPTPRGACDAGWYFSTTSRGADTHSRIGVTQSNYNGTTSTATSTFTAQATGTVSATVSGGANVSLSAKVASIGATYGISAQVSLSVTLGNSTTVSVAPGKTANANYGAWRAYVTGTEKYRTTSCTVTSTRTTTVYSPYRIGWYTWVS